ncbi:MAG: DUF4115 domain-containing protein [Gammaproteobacteria bacterium]|nr:DUF4115 domain-containing protein [Gammaproteobacteria bacterium]
MSDETDKDDVADANSEPTGPVGGERLAEARRALQIPVLEIAKELHLDEHKVRALEANRFDVIGAPVFAKGHLRKYAQLVNVDQADVMADYYLLNRAGDAPPVIAKRPKQNREISPGPWAAVIVVIIIAATAYWWFAVRDPDVTPASGAIAPLPQVTNEDDDSPGLVANEPTIELPGQGAPAEEVVELPTDVEAQIEQSQDSQPQVVETDGLRLSVTYNGDCWTEITDASGRRLFFDLGKAGRTVNLSGDAPFNVLFGNAGNVSLEVNGARYDIPAASRRGRTARLTITGP